MSDLEVFILGDDPLVRAGLALMLEQQEGVRVIGRGTTLAEAQSLAAPVASRLSGLPGVTMARERGESGALAALRPMVILWDLGPDPKKAEERLVAARPLVAGGSRDQAWMTSENDGEVQILGGIVWLAPDGTGPGWWQPDHWWSPGQWKGSVEMIEPLAPSRGLTPFGVLRREASAEVIVEALRATSLGLAVIDTGFMDIPAGRPTGESLPPRGAATRPSIAPDATPGSPMPTGIEPAMGEGIEPLTPREAEVLRLAAEGLPNKLIAVQLGISEHTVKYHINAILGKLQASSRTEAVTRAARLGWIIL